MMVMGIGSIGVAYLLGSICSAILVCKLLGKPDPRTQGSRNPGATNVLRCGGRFAALLTLIGDFTKGWLPVMVAQSINLPPVYIGGIMLAALLGHLYPLYFGFKGGKGVATMLGVIYGLNLELGLLATATWVVIATIFRYVSLASLVMVVLLPCYAYWLQLHSYCITLAVLAGLVGYAHRKNIYRLWQGQEPKLGKIRGSEN